jgi:hypothetical protein
LKIDVKNCLDPTTRRADLSSPRDNTDKL